MQTHFKQRLSQYIFPILLCWQPLPHLTQWMWMCVIYESCMEVVLMWLQQALHWLCWTVLTVFLPLCPAPVRCQWRTPCLLTSFLNTTIWPYTQREQQMQRELIWVPSEPYRNVCNRQTASDLNTFLLLCLLLLYKSHFQWWERSLVL